MTRTAKKHSQRVHHGIIEAGFAKARWEIQARRVRPTHTVPYGSLRTR